MKGGKLNTKTIIKFIIFLIVILGIIYFVNYYGLKDYLTPNKIKEAVLMFGPLAPLGFILIYYKLQLLSLY